MLPPVPECSNASALLISLEDEACLRAHAETAFPRESCGLLLGSFDGRTLRIGRVLPTPNGATDSSSFRIHPQRVLDAVRWARSEGLALVGAYHSHPSGSAVPSVADRDDAWGELVHVIVSCEQGTAAAARVWRLTPDSVVELDVELIELTAPDR